jgi:tellurite resistance protein
MTKQCRRPSITQAAFKADYLDHHDKEVMQALATAGALVALADGRVQAVERNEFVNYVDRQGLVPTISQDDIAKAFNLSVRQLEHRYSADVIAEVFRPLAGLSLASVVVRAAERVAAADRKIHPGESRALELIRLLMMNLPTKRPPAGVREW